MPELGSAFLPSIIYGTAWKEEQTQSLVVIALQTGFRAIDTACQPKHYNEAGVGKGIAQVLNEKWLKREDIFIQTKFTPLRGQDPNDVPYNKDAILTDQVRQSFTASLRNLKVEYLDSILLHSPLPHTDDTIRVYRVFEEFYDQQKVKYLGISNCYDLATLTDLYNTARIKPTFLQNRFYSKSGFDKDIRAFCDAHGIVYQSFWTLTAQRHFLKGHVMHDMASKYSRTPEQVFFAFTRQLNILPLSGTKSVEHMKDDLGVTGMLQAPALVLDGADITRIQAALYDS